MWHKLSTTSNIYIKNKQIQTISTKCQYHIAKTKPKWWLTIKWLDNSVKMKLIKKLLQQLHAFHVILLHKKCWSINRITYIKISFIYSYVCKHIDKAPKVIVTIKASIVSENVPKQYLYELKLQKILKLLI